MLNDVNHQWGGNVKTMAADPNVFGRVYLGLDGRGIIVGNPASSLPSGWTDAEINGPGNPGWATSATALSTGTTVNQWSIVGGGAGISGTSDQFHFAFQSNISDASISAKLAALTNADGTGGTPQAGVMFRAGSGAGVPFAAMMQDSGNNLVFEYRTSPAASVSTVSLGGVPVGAEYLRIMRSGNNFSAYYGTNGTTWSQLGPIITIPSMPAAASAGLAATASYNPQLSSTTFTNVVVNTVPTIAIPAGSTPNPTNGTTAVLAVAWCRRCRRSQSHLHMGRDEHSDRRPAPTYSANGSNSAKNATVTFYKAGNYTLQVTIADAGGLTTSSSVNVTVNQALTSIVVSPTSANLANGATEPFSALALDQFGDPLATQPSLTWSLDTGSVGTIDSSGLYSSPDESIGSAVVRATSATVSGSAAVNISWLRGDLHIDGRRDSTDLVEMLRALVDVDGYLMANSLNHDDLIAIGDLSGDGLFNNADIQAMIHQLIQDAVPPADPPLAVRSQLSPPATAIPNEQPKSADGTYVPTTGGAIDSSPNAETSSNTSAATRRFQPGEYQPGQTLQNTHRKRRVQDRARADPTGCRKGAHGEHQLGC